MYVCMYVFGENLMFFVRDRPTLIFGKSIILISYLNVFLLFIILLLDYIKVRKKTQKNSAFDIVESRSKEMWSVSHVTCIDLIAEVS